MKLHRDSHTDHALTPAQLSYVLERFGDHQTPIKTTVEMPEDLGTAPCALYGPTVGDAAISETEVTHANRGSRAWTSRLVDRPARGSRMLTVIAGPHDGEPCVLYTVFGGPLAPREPGEVTRDLERAIASGAGIVAIERLRTELGESEAFWSEHALALAQ